MTPSRPEPRRPEPLDIIDDQPKEIWIIVFTDGTIESVWTNEALAKSALETHALDSGCPIGYYHIVKRRLDRLHLEERK